MYLARNHHEAIISHEDFEAAGRILEQHAKKRISHQTVRNISSAMLFQERSSAENVAALSSAGFITQQERVTSRGAVIPTLLIRKPAR